MTYKAQKQCSVHLAASGTTRTSEEGSCSSGSLEAGRTSVEAGVSAPQGERSVAYEFAGWLVSFDPELKVWQHFATDPDGAIGDGFAVIRPLHFADGLHWCIFPKES